MASCWENHENSSKRPQGYKPQLSIDEAKKKLSEAKKKWQQDKATIKMEQQRSKVQW